MIKRFFLSERNMMIAIILNSIIIFLLYFPNIENHNGLVQIDHFFVCVFLAEAIVKLIVFKPKNYFASNWNRFDFILVILTLPSLFLSFVPLPDTSSLLLLRIFRLFRLARLFRLLKFIPNLATTISGLTRALRASVFVLLILLILNFVLAVICCHFYQTTAPQYFGNPLISSYTVFQLFTIEGWNEVSDVIASKSTNELISGMGRLYFLLIVFIGGIFGVSLANAVFVDEMTMDNTKHLEKKIDDLQEDVAKLRDLIEQQNIMLKDK